MGVNSLLQRLGSYAAGMRMPGIFLLLNSGERTCLPVRLVPSRLRRDGVSEQDNNKVLVGIACLPVRQGFLAGPAYRQAGLPRGVSISVNYEDNHYLIYYYRCTFLLAKLQ
jgi:hypothetical protein